ncbi:dihydrofolate reductase family protein [Brachybacterium avium]|uniref:dihydrofolate reductase family protein n=1 Tax=Brachybacterium avium TaxID=2017485 RepID=UPI0023B0DCCE|nr:dihydrofolate reductase family protein [Brachybacterium avium]
MRALKESAGGPLLVHGSARLVQSLVAADLVDRYHLLTFPVLLGAGKRLFAADAPAQRLELVRSADFSNGVRMAVYDVRRDSAPADAPAPADV